MSHLTSDEIIAAAERTLHGPRQTHLDECAACGLQVREMAALLREVQAVAVPEPSPLFWNRFSDQVRGVIAAQPASPRLVRWFQWPVLAPLAALALLVIALASALPPSPALQPADEIADASASLSLPFEVTDDEEAHWQLMAALLSDVDVEAADDSIAAPAGAAEDVVRQMSSGEQEELLRLLREELGQSGG